jgi:hypothetical protein
VPGLGVAATDVEVLDIILAKVSLVKLAIAETTALIITISPNLRRFSLSFIA